ncbi:hypothetical protein BB560_002353 [Smittium megazygosporum]|uniref:Uncharacterized protein n=1 Tax=Smittium megazygosporum TaxID=133381 RepID=A0A2T9ZF35_9FUNG|nr:hypothetical protein BB560_002353 [Smittium megazygosporum]
MTTYLGIPFTKDGIDWKTHIESTAKKAAGVLRFLRATCDSWPPLIRLFLFRAFVASIWEYGVPLLFLTDKQLLATYQEIQDDAPFWIFDKKNRKGKSYIQLAHSFAMTERVVDRFSSLLTRFGLHFEMSNESNPLRTLVDFFRFKKIELSSESLVSKGIYSTLDYRAIMDSAPYGTKRKKLFLDEAVKKRKIKSLSKGKPGTIISRVLPESRNENNGIDVSLYISDKTGSRNAVKWRFNTFGIDQNAQFVKVFLV